MNPRILITKQGQRLEVDATPMPLPACFHGDSRLMGQPRCILHEGRYFIHADTAGNLWMELDPEEPPRGMRLTGVQMMDGKAVRTFIEDKP